jgi:acyl-CoA reductase-like NAD-dependent aldehyde dehydrogenase
MERAIDTRFSLSDSCYCRRKCGYLKGKARCFFQTEDMLTRSLRQGSELSPRMHHFIAQLFQDAGFPPGVLNFLIHRPQDAVEVYDSLIKHPSVRKVNFTGSTGIGRAIASKAGSHLKPALLELGGKNSVVVLQDADLEKAAQAIVTGATLNVFPPCPDRPGTTC